MSTATITTKSYFNGAGLGDPLMTAISSVLTSAGWTRTADTGQTASFAAVNLAVTPTNQIWKMNDSLAGASPIYMRIDTRAASQILFDFTFGSGTNGSGTITGQIGPKITAYPGSYNNTTTMPSYFSATADSFQMYLFHSTTITYPLFFVMERTKDNSGNGTADGISVVVKESIDGTRQFYLPRTGGYVPYSEVKCFYPTGATSLANGGNVSVAPIVVGNTVELKGSMLGVVGYANADLTAFNPVSISVLGATHTYLPTSHSIGSSLSTSAMFAMLYE